MTQSATGVKLEDIALGGISQSQKDKLRFRLHRPLEESHAERQRAGAGRRGSGGGAGRCLMETSCGRTVRADGCATLWIRLMPLSRMLKNG